MNSPYLSEKKRLIDNLVKLYPYSRNWFESKSNHVLIALLKNKNKKKREK